MYGNHESTDNLSLDVSETTEKTRVNTWGDFLPRRSHVTPQDWSYSTSHTPSPVNKRSSAQREAELIYARNRISQLELELSKSQNAAKRARIDTEERDGRERQSVTVSQELQRLHRLDEERQMLVEQLAEARYKLEEREKEEGEEKRRLQALVSDCERKNREQGVTIEELQSEVSSLTNQNLHLHRQLDVARSECAVVKAGLGEQLQAQTAVVGTLRHRVTELDGIQEKWETEQERVKELQHKLKQVRHDIQFAEMVQSKVLHSEELERELRQLREENTALRDHTDNVGLMRYQLETLREQVERSDNMEKKAVRLEEENKLLRKQLATIDEGTGGMGGRSSGMQCKVTELQHREVVLLSQIGELQSRLKLVERSAEKAEALTTETQKQLTKEQEECKLRADKVQRLERKLLFVTKERDGCVDVLNSYRLDSGVDALLKENLAEVERQLGSAKDRIAELETEVEELTAAATTGKT